MGDGNLDTTCQKCSYIGSTVEDLIILSLSSTRAISNWARKTLTLFLNSLKKTEVRQQVGQKRSCVSTRDIKVVEKLPATFQWLIFPKRSIILNNGPDSDLPHWILLLISWKGLSCLTPKSFISENSPRVAGSTNESPTPEPKRVKQAHAIPQLYRAIGTCIAGSAPIGRSWKCCWIRVA